MAKKKKSATPAALVRAEIVLKDVEIIRELREHFYGYEARDGYSLDARKIEQMPAYRRRAMRKKYVGLQRILGSPRVAVKPHDKAEAKILRRETHQRFKGQKHFLVAVPDPERSTVKIVAGQVKITTHLPGKAEVEEMFFRFPRKPKTPADLIVMLQEMLPGMPTTGTYYIVTTAGEFGYTTDYGQLEKELRETLDTYDDKQYGAHRYLFQVLGFRWVRNKLADKIITQHRSAAREARREANRKAAERMIEKAKRGAQKS
jgi:hypothetical protein